MRSFFYGFKKKKILKMRVLKNECLFKNTMLLNCLYKNTLPHNYTS